MKFDLLNLQETSIKNKNKKRNERRSKSRRNKNYITNNEEDDEKTSTEIPRPSSDELNDRDKISRLPPEIHQHIASFLDVSSRLRFSLLSTTFEFLWKDNFSPNVIFALSQFPSFEYKIRRYFGYEKEMYKAESGYHYFNFDPLQSQEFIKFEERVLTNSKSSSSIKRFSFSCKDNDISIERLNRYISAAIVRLVQEIHLSISPVHVVDLSASCSLFTCSSLRVLEFEHANNSGFLEIDFPDEIFLPNLEHLFVKRVSLKKNWDFLSTCPVLKSVVFKVCYLCFEGVFNICSRSLKKLVVEDFYEDSFNSCGVNITTPNLTYLRIADSIERKFTMQIGMASPKVDLQLKMEEAYTLEVDILTESKENYGKNLMYYLETITNARDLMLGTCFTRVMSESPSVLEGKPVSFHHLKCLKLNFWLYRNCIPAISYMLRNAPNLESLALETLLHRYTWKPIKVLFWYEDCFDAAIIEDGWEAELTEFSYELCSLRTVEIKNFLGCEEEFRLLKFLLKSAKNLETIVLVANKECCSNLEKMRIQVSEKLEKLKGSPSNITVNFSSKNCD
ncbi:hypothetical protein ACHQM5_003072 [Ranunculus cassubicifolius]